MIDYHALAPEIILGVTIIVVLTLDVSLPRPKKYWTSVAALIGLAAAAVPLMTLAFGSDNGARQLLDGGYVVDEFALVAKGLFIVAGYIVLLMSVSYIESETYYQGEYYLLLLVSILGSVVMASSRDLITLFIGLEMVTGPLFLLAGWRKPDVKSNEASLKFFILGVLSTAILLYGMSFLYGMTGSVRFDGIREAAGTVGGEPAFQLAVLFTLIGFAFKVSAVPFHFWAPDTYEGAPTPVTAYLSVSSKAAGFVGLLLISYVAFPVVSDIWGPALWILAALSMTVGNLIALRQDNVVRLLAYSSIAQAGFMLVPFAAAAVSGAEVFAGALAATMVYIIIYAFMNLGAFAVVIAVSRKTASGDIDSWAGLSTYAPGLGAAAALFFFSLAGIPPLAGWFAKFVMFRAILAPGDVWTTVLAAIAAVNAVIALYYYARIAKVVWMDPVPATAPSREVREARVAPSLALAMGLALLFVVVTGFLPQIAAFFGEASKLVIAGL